MTTPTLEIQYRWNDHWYTIEELWDGPFNAIGEVIRNADDQRKDIFTKHMANTTNMLPIRMKLDPDQDVAQWVDMLLEEDSYFNTH